VTVRLTAAATGDELAAFHATAVRPEADLMPALGKVGGSLRRRIGESLREVRADPPLPRFTTSSLEALRLYAIVRSNPGGPGGDVPALRRIVALDSNFAYAWLALGLRLGEGLAASDSALAMAYRFRDGMTPMEHSQVTALYLKNVELDTRRAIVAYENALARDSVQWLSILNLGQHLNLTRQFERSEAHLRRYHGVDSVGHRAVAGIAIALVGQGNVSAAESILDAYPEIQSLGTTVQARFLAATAALRYDTAEVLAASLPPLRPAVVRVRGRLAEARLLEHGRDSSAAVSRREAAIAFDPAFARQLRAANEALWLLREPAGALATLDSAFAARPASTLRENRDRMDAVRAAALYAAAGRPGQARAILDTVVANSDRLALRAIHPFRYDALGEIALAEGRPRDAMQDFRQSDLAADGLPATQCAVCILPKLARAAEQAGWADSARIFWERYVTTVALDRLPTDQWFLAMAFERFEALHSEAGDTATAAEYRARRAALWRNADPELRRRATAGR
jgi:tetratricopeptide (TPR) repeat protein